MHSKFVDNSLQSGCSNITALRKLDGKYYKLLVEIELHDDYIEIRDNAAGIAISDYARAFLPAAIPPDTSGLSEFGLGMKAAASWFARTWIVRTKAIGENVERSIVFDIPMIVKNNIEKLQPTENRVNEQKHFTVITLSNLLVKPKGRTLDKIKDHLGSIYRLFIRDNLLEIKVDGTPLIYEPPVFLEAPYHSTPDNKPIIWQKNFNMVFNNDHSVKGWAGILARGSVTNAGFALFRRRRLIQGSCGEAYRPEYIFGKANKFVYQRLIGELEVQGFSVSHTKDGIQWEDWEDDILKWLKSELNTKPIPLLDQAANYRAHSNMIQEVISEAPEDATHIIAQHLSPIIEEQLNNKPKDEPLATRLEKSKDEKAKSTSVKIEVNHALKHWSITIELIDDISHEEWYELSQNNKQKSEIEVHIRMNLAHPFMDRFVSPDGDEIIPFTRLAAGLAIAEITAREAGVRQAGTIRRNLNQILRSLSGPIKKSGK